MMNLKEILIKVREKISPPGAWTQRSYARDANGVGVDACSSLACQWCLMGAVYAVAPSVSGIEEKLRPLFLTDDLVKWNDAKDRSQAYVLLVLDGVIQKL